jgi:hypothetical protein
MKSLIKGGFVALLLAGASMPAYATNGGSASASESSTVTIIRPISVTANGNGLQFGTLVAPLSGSGTATVDPSTGNINYSGLDHASGATGRADFTVNGEAGQAFTLVVPTSVTMAGPGTNIVVTTTSNVATGSTVQTLGGTFPAAGTPLDVGVGGTITIPSGQASGAYSGTVTVTATYN